MFHGLRQNRVVHSAYGRRRYRRIRFQGEAAEVGVEAGDRDRRCRRCDVHDQHGHHQCKSANEPVTGYAAHSALEIRE